MKFDWNWPRFRRSCHLKIFFLFLAQVAIQLCETVIAILVERHIRNSLVTFNWMADIEGVVI